MWYSFYNFMGKSYFWLLVLEGKEEMTQHESLSQLLRERLHACPAVNHTCRFFSEDLGLCVTRPAYNVYKMTHCFTEEERRFEDRAKEWGMKKEER